MKFFRLELINRENNYNRMFNANPHVGVMNVLDNNKQVKFINYIYIRYYKKAIIKNKFRRYKKRKYYY